MRKKTFWLITVFTVVFWFSSMAAAFDQQECIDCHDIGSTASRRIMDVEQFNASIHGENASCEDCHTMVTDESHMEVPGSGVVDCNQCHEQENYHGGSRLQDSALPQCADCHTRHNIHPVDDGQASVNNAHLVDTCGQCHPAQSGHTDYFSWLPSVKIETHPKGDFGTDYGENNCIGCHQGQGAHGETEPIDDATCYRCHMTPEGEKALLGFVHPRADAADQPGVFAVGIVYQLVVLACIVGGVIFFVRKFSGN